MARKLPWATTTDAVSPGPPPAKRQRTLHPGASASNSARHQPQLPVALHASTGSRIRNTTTTLPKTPTKPTRPSHRNRHNQSSSSRTPSSSPPPAAVTAQPPPSPLRPGYDHDDIYMMVEDEFQSLAQSYTAHLHHAEYKRLVKLARKKQLPKHTVADTDDDDDDDDVDLDIEGTDGMSKETKLKLVREKLQRGQKRALAKVASGGRARGDLSDDDDEDDNDDDGEDPDVKTATGTTRKPKRNAEREVTDLWRGTHLGRLIRSGNPSGTSSTNGNIGGVGDGTGGVQKTSLLGLEKMSSSTRAARGFERIDYASASSSKRKELEDEELREERERGKRRERDREESRSVGTGMRLRLTKEEVEADDRINSGYIGSNGMSKGKQRRGRHDDDEVDHDGMDGGVVRFAKFDSTTSRAKPSTAQPNGRMHAQVSDKLSAGHHDKSLAASNLVPSLSKAVSTTTSFTTVLSPKKPVMKKKKKPKNEVDEVDRLDTVPLFIS